MSIYLVTGGAGFIGSHIIRELVKQGKRVRCLDNASASNVQVLRDLRGEVEWRFGDIRDQNCLRETLDGVDYVLHQAALPSVKRSIENPFLTNEVNVSGTLSLLLAARDAGVRRFVYASSSSVYGDTDRLPKSEDMAPCPISPYAISKYIGELYCQSFYRHYDLPTVILRYFNVFGVGQKQGSPYSAVIPNFLSSVANGSPAVIYGNGEQTRDFTYVQNVVDANLLAASVDGIEGEVFNIACGVEISLNALWGLFVELTNSHVSVEYESQRPGDVFRSVACIDKASKLLGYKPTISLRSGLERVLDESIIYNR